MKYLNYLTLVAIFVLLPSQLPAQEYWAGFSNVQYDGEYFYAVAKQLYQVVKLDKEGNVVNVLGKRGRGPTEFSTDDLKLLLTDGLLYVLDDRAMTITKIDKNTFKNYGREIIKKPASNIILYDQKLYAYVTDFEETDPLETGKEVNVFRPINQLRNPNSSLFKVKDPNPVNPFYDGELVDASNNTVVIAREGKGTLTIFHNGSLKRRKIPFIEKLSLGEEMKGDTEFLERPIIKVVWKKKIMPEYILMKSVYLDGQMIYFQVHSYKEGDALITYNIQTDTFDKVGTLSQGRLIAVDNDTVYTLNHTTINTTTLSDIRSCSDEAVVFYLSSDAFKEQCTTCTNSFFKWYDYAKQYNIPVKLVLEDDSWFGKEEIDASSINNLTQWNLWGEISYKKDCDDCFTSSITVRITSNGNASKFYSFPKPISILKNKLACTD